eukprot:Em0020g610a
MVTKHISSKHQSSITQVLLNQLSDRLESLNTNQTTGRKRKRPLSSTVFALTSKQWKQLKDEEKAEKEEKKKANKKRDEQDFYKCPDRLRLPLIFYIGHTATLYINKLSLAGLVRMQINPGLEAMFETGVDEMSWDDTENYRLGGAYKWPALKDVLDYRKQVYELLINLINSASLEMPITMESKWWSLFMGIEHERMHIETSSVLLRQMPVTMLQRPLNWKYGPRYAEKPAGTNKFVKVPGGEVKIGKPVAFPSYGWDNEYGELVLSVPEFECSKYLVTNKDFMGFVRSGAYSCREMWTKEVKGVNLVVGLTYPVTVIATFNHMNSQKKSRTSTEQYLMFLRCLGIGLLKSTTMKQRPSAHGRVQIIVSQLKQSITVCEVQRHFYQHTGFRLVRSSGETPVRLLVFTYLIKDRSIVVPNVNSKVALIESMNTQFQYETEETLAAELDKEYHQPDYCNALCCLIDNVIMKYDIKTASALVFGCGVGRSSFELSKQFNKVVGIDYCGRFIDAAKRIQTKIAHGQFTDGLHLMDPTDIEASCIEFKQLTWIPKEVSPTDLVLFEFLERLNNPKAWICRLWECVKPNSFLIILTCSTQCTTSWIQSCLLQWFTLQERMEVAGSYTVSIWQRQ